MTHTKQINNEINDWPSIEPELAVQNVGLHSCCGDEFNADHVRYVKYSDNVDACNKPDFGLSTKKMINSDISIDQQKFKSIPVLTFLYSRQY